MAKKKSKKNIASLADPTLEAVAGGMFRFTTQAQAVSLMQRLSNQYRIAKDQEPVKSGECPTLKIWIRGYEVTKEEEEKGYKGNFALISVSEVAEGKFSLVAKKLDVPLNKHVQKKPPPRRHPNNGHPVIRAAQRNKTYAKIEDARVLLLQMHEDFPETSIPGRDKLHVMLYSRQYKPPIHKVTVRIVAAPGEGYKFEISDNVREKHEVPPQEPEKKESKVAKAKEMVEGKFTSMVALQRKKKPKPSSKK